MKLKNWEIKNFRNRKISEIKNFRNRKFQKSKISEIKNFRNRKFQKSKISEIENFRNRKGPGEDTGAWHARFARAVGVSSETLVYATRWLIYLLFCTYLTIQHCVTIMLKKSLLTTGASGNRTGYPSIMRQTC